MEEGLKGHPGGEIRGGDGQQKEDKGPMEQEGFPLVVRKMGQKALQDTAVVKADDEAKKKKGSLAGGPVADDGKVGGEPVGAADKKDRINGDDDISS